MVLNYFDSYKPCAFSCYLQNFLDILSKVSRGSTQEKLQWVFGLYDLDGDGLISKTEMVDVVSSIYEMMGRSTEPTVENGSAKEHVEKIFHVNILHKYNTLYYIFCIL